MDTYNIIPNAFDAHRFASKDEYSIYYNLLLYYLENLVTSRDELLLSKQETALIQQYIQYFTRTLQALRLRYLYDSEHSVRIDVHESGFPSYSELRNMYSELIVTRKSLSTLPSIEQIKTNVLDLLFQTKKQLPEEVLAKSSIQYYLRTTVPEDIFYKFMRSRLLIADSSEVPSNTHLLSWSAFDVNLNRPLVYFMYFTYSGTDLEADIPQIHKVVESNGNYLRPLSLTASFIDKELITVHPKLIKCVDIGPLHSAFSQDENPISNLIQKGMDERILDAQTACLEVHIDTIRSIGETTAKASILWGKEHQVFQTYLTPKGNTRGATETKHYMLGSHRLLQYLSSQQATQPSNYIIIPEIQTDKVQKQL